jgi:hypothetical protein
MLIRDTKNLGKFDDFEGVGEHAESLAECFQTEFVSGNQANQKKTF